MQFLSNYLTGPIHRWWVDKVWRPSWTRLVTWVYGLPAAIVVVFQQLAAWGNDTTIAQYIDKMNMPNWVPMAFTALALISYIAHGRKAGEA